MTAKKHDPIPQPPTVPLLGNLPDLDSDDFNGSLTHLAKKYGPIYRLTIPGGWRLVIISSWSLVNEVCDDARFEKSIEGEIEELRNSTHDGLFTARGEQEENWGVAHRVLMSAFGPMSIRGMFGEMHEVATQLALKWARHGPLESIDIGEDFTRLTLETVALCSMGFRFNSYYSAELHPFIRAMYEVLGYVGKKTTRLPLPSVFYRSSNKKYLANIKLLRRTAREVIDSRKAAPKDADGRRDLLSAMLTGVDPRTGRSMTEESIIDNLITFLVAGHETTASTLTFVMYNLLKHPEAYRKAQEEVDQVVGTGAITVEHGPKLKYLNAVLRETLRGTSPIPGIGRQAKKDEIIGGKYPVKAGEQLVLYTPLSQRDPAVFGSTAEDFDPERMLDENFDRLQSEFPNSWMPFGTGIRGCIGRPFAWQEMILALAVLLQNFNFIMDNPAYVLQISETLTIKPKNFKVRAIPRNGISPMQMEARLAGGYAHGTSSANGKPASEKSKVNGSGPSKGNKIAIYYGSNAGTCEFMAQKAASNAASHGFDASIDRLDAAKESLPKDIPVLIITASYEGQPPDNAGHFVQWIENLKDGHLKGVNYAVFGCGHRDWVSTYQRIPKLIDDTLHRLGGERMTPIYSTDANNRDMFSDFESWEDQYFWPSVKARFGGGSEDQNTTDSALQVTFSTPRASSLRQDVKEALVVESRILSKGEQYSQKRHLDIQLPSHFTYAAGDYLAVLPHNPREVVSRAMRRFRLAWDAHISIKAAGPTTLPIDASVPVSDILNSYVELSQAATKRNLLVLSQHADDEQLKTEFEQLANDGFEGVREKRLSVLDILERHPQLQVPFQHFLAMLPPMRVRQYSISSSPLAEADVASLTYEVLDEPSYSGIGRHTGVASSYLATLRPGDKVQIAVRKAAGGFHLPLEADKQPIICIAAGTGLAPFRAFFQERAIKVETGQSVSSAVLFYGCRDPEADDLYRDEFDKWEKLGAVKVFRAFSRKTELSEGCRYVQDRVWREKETVGQLWRSDARIYVCGTNKMAEGAKEVLVRIIRDLGMTEQEAMDWFVKHRNERFATDVFD